MQNVVGAEAATIGYKKVSLLNDEAQPAGCLRKPEGIPLEWDAGIQ